MQIHETGGEKEKDKKVRVQNETEVQYDEMNTRKKQFRPARWFL